ncbi:MAG: hypothetical protein C0593_02655 [Marinilabiliales bacterium]|nr:MAG: hypothetical protein C0593_02655 [Marinilabiliales bacterium]
MRRIILTLLLCGAAFFSFSQMQDTAIILNEVVIEGAAVKRALRYQKESVADAVVVGSRDINNYGNKSAGEVLKRLPRISIDGSPALRNVKISGLDKEFQCILVDGLHPGGGEDRRDFKVDRIPVDLIDRIEVIYNPTVEYGTDAATGAVNMILKTTPEKRLFQGDMAIDYSTTEPGINPEFNVMYGNRHSKLGYFGSLGRAQYQRESFSNLYDADTGGVASSISGVISQSLLANVEFYADSNTTLKWETWYSGYQEIEEMYSTANIRSKGGLNTSIDSAKSDIFRNLINSRLGFDRKLRNGEIKSAILFAYDDEARYKDRLRDKETYWEKSLEDENQDNYQALAESKLTLKLNTGSVDHTLKAGVRAVYLNRDYDRIVYTKPQEYLFWETIEDGSYKIEETQLAAYMMDIISLNSLDIIPGIRAEETINTFQTASDNGNSANFALNPALHLKYTTKNNLLFRAAVTRQMTRPPFLYTVPVDKVKLKKQIIERGNPELLPANSINFSASVEKYIGNESYIAARGYYNMVKNMFEMQFTGIDDFYNFRVYQAVNIDTAKVYGAELDGRFNLAEIGLEGFNLYANYSWSGSKVRDAGTGEIRRINEQPVHLVNVQGSYFNPKLRLQMDLAMKYNSEMIIAATYDEFNNEYPEMITEPQMWFDGRIKWYFNAWGAIYLNALNILNEKMVIHQGEIVEEMETGVNIRVGVSFNL